MNGSIGSIPPGWQQSVPDMPPGYMQMIMSATSGIALLSCAIVGNGSLKDIKKIIDHAPKELTRRSKKNEDIYVGTKATPGYLPIHYAAERGRLDIIKLLLQARNKEGCYFEIDDDGSNNEDPANSCNMTKTPFYIAVQCNKIAVARFLGKSGADVNFESKDTTNGGRVIGSAFFCCATRAQGFPGIKMARILCNEFGVNVNACGYFKLSEKGEQFERIPVLVAAVRKLVRSDLLPISFSKRGEMSVKNAAMMTLLLRKGADVNMRGEHGETALFELTSMLTHDTGEAGVDKMFLVCMFVQGYGANLKYKYAFGGKPSLTLVEMVNLMLASSTNVKLTKAMHKMKAVFQSFKTCAHGRNNCAQKAKNQCQRCKTVRYCCVEHQREDWNLVHAIPDPKWYEDAVLGGATWRSSVKGHKDTCKNVQKYRQRMKKVKETGGCAIVKIQLVGLISKPELNGLIGTRSTFNTETKRYLCVFDDPEIPCVNVKKKNFVELDDNQAVKTGPSPSSPPSINLDEALNISQRYSESPSISLGDALGDALAMAYNSEIGNIETSQRKCTGCGKPGQKEGQTVCQNCYDDNRCTRCGCGNPGKIEGKTVCQKCLGSKKKSSRLTVQLGAALAGNPSPAFHLARKYEDGKGVKQSYEKALSFYTAAARSSNASNSPNQHHAMFSLGFMYYHGNGVEQSNKLAREWWMKGAQRGNSDCKRDLEKYLLL